jgi:hypothetical protein
MSKQVSAALKLEKVRGVQARFFEEPRILHSLSLPVSPHGAKRQGSNIALALPDVLLQVPQQPKTQRLATLLCLSLCCW